MNQPHVTYFDGIHIYQVIKIYNEYAPDNRWIIYFSNRDNLYHTPDNKGIVQILVYLPQAWKQSPRLKCYDH